MTLVELAEARGISKASAARLVRRHRWRRQTDNTGRVRAPGSIRCNRAIGRSAASPVDMSAIVSTLEAAIITLRDQLEVANARADRADAALTGERARADALRDRLEAAEDTARVAREAADAPRQGTLPGRRGGWWRGSRRRGGGSSGHAAPPVDYAIAHQRPTCYGRMRPSG
jgi:hypothetical protein